MVSARMIAKSAQAVSVSHPLPHVDDYLAIGQQAGASDIHLGVNAPPLWRLHGILRPIWPDVPRFTAAQTAALADGFLPDLQKSHLVERGDADFAYANQTGRFRTSVVRQRLGTDIVFRIINTQVRNMDELGLPQHLKLLTRYQNGLILVTGSVGSGKSTTLAVRGSLREDPDVIMVGEMRDLETISLAITASETGHLVLGTLHTGNASRTLDRLLDVFPVDQQEQIRIMVSESLRGIISQQLVPLDNGSGRVLALETLTNTPAVANVIREARTYMLPGIIQTGKKQGMQLMDDSLADLYQRGLISVQETYARAEQKQLMRHTLKI
jgi:twitching motility protein PilT